MDSILRAKLKRLVEHQDWEAIHAFAGYTKDRWHNETVKEEDQFNTVWNMAKKEGKVEGLTKFLEDVEQLALDD